VGGILVAGVTKKAYNIKGAGQVGLGNVGMLSGFGARKAPPSEQSAASSSPLQLRPRSPRAVRSAPLFCSACATSASRDRVKAEGRIGELKDGLDRERMDSDFVRAAVNAKTKELEQERASLMVRSAELAETLKTREILTIRS